MANIFVISDTHLNHANILNFTRPDGSKVRTFSDVYDMNETMIERWNAVVRPQDKVYHLGDVYFGNEEEASVLLRRLNGHKRLVVGNHDRLNSKALANNFEKISMWRMFRDKGLLLTHVPVHESTLGEDRFDKKKMINVHGHIHANEAPSENHVCVCVEHTDYFPVNIESFI